MPSTCPFSPANDQYATQEVMKRRLAGEWMCSVCGKSYKKEEELESHLVDNHNVEKTGSCLADHCDILRCELLYDDHKDNTKCDDNQLASMKRKCMDMVRDLCSPDHSDPKEKLQIEVSVQASVCAYLTCEHYWTLPKEETSGGHYYYTVYAVSFGILLVLLAVYFKIASSNIDSSASFEEIMANADQYERPKPTIIPPDPNMEIRHRNPNIDRQWSENE